MNTKKYWTVGIGIPIVWVIFWVGIFWYQRNTPELGTLAVILSGTVALCFGCFGIIHKALEKKAGLEKEYSAQKPRIRFAGGAHSLVSQVTFINFGGEALDVELKTEGNLEGQFTPRPSIPRDTRFHIQLNEPSEYLQYFFFEHTDSQGNREKTRFRWEGVNKFTLV